MSNNSEKKVFTVHDLFLLVFYAIIIAMGFLVFRTRGIGTPKSYLFAMAISCFGVLFAKLAKYHGNLKAHISELVFVGVICVLAVVAVFGTIL